MSLEIINYILNYLPKAHRGKTKKKDTKDEFQTINNIFAVYLRPYS